MTKHDLSHPRPAVLRFSGVYSRNTYPWNLTKEFCFYVFMCLSEKSYSSFENICVAKKISVCFQIQQRGTIIFCCCCCCSSSTPFFNSRWISQPQVQVTSSFCSLKLVFTFGWRILPALELLCLKSAVICKRLAFYRLETDCNKQETKSASLAWHFPSLLAFSNLTTITYSCHMTQNPFYFLQLLIWHIFESQ